MALCCLRQQRGCSQGQAEELPDRDVRIFQEPLSVHIWTPLSPVLDSCIAIRDMQVPGAMHAPRIRVEWAGPAPPRRLGIGRTQQAPTGPNQAKRGVGGAELLESESLNRTSGSLSGSSSSSSSLAQASSSSLSSQAAGTTTTTRSTARAALVHSLTDC